MLLDCNDNGDVAGLMVGILWISESMLQDECSDEENACKSSPDECRDEENACRSSPSAIMAPFASSNSKE